jgi:methionyl-tRNA formyltransferase
MHARDGAALTLRVILAGNGSVAAEVAETILASGDEIVALILHPEERRRSGEQIIAASNVSPDRIHGAARLGDPQLVAELSTLRPEIGVAAYFGYILPAELFGSIPHGFVNLHPSLLPYNRGAYPNVWSIVERTPAGVTLHYVDRGVDTGDIIAQREVPVTSCDTGETLYRRLEREAVALFRESWPAIRSGTAARSPQQGPGTSHKAADVRRIDEIDLARRYTARELIDLIRAQTFPPHRGAYFVEGSEKVYLRLQLHPEAEIVEETEASDEGGG